MAQVERIVPEPVTKIAARRFEMKFAISQLVPQVLTASPVERQGLIAVAAKEALQARQKEWERLRKIVGEDPRKWLEEHIRSQTRIYRLWEEYEKKRRAEPVMAEVITPAKEMPKILVALPKPLEKAIRELDSELERQRRIAMPAELRAEFRALTNLKARLERKKAQVVALATSYGLLDNNEVKMALMQADARLQELDERIRRKAEQIRAMEERERAAMGVT